MRVRQPGQPPVAIKGTRDGLLFLLDEFCPFDALLLHLDEVLDGEGAVLFSEGEVAVSIDFGNRTLSNAEHRQLLEVFLKRENFMIREFGPRTMSKQSVVPEERRFKQSVVKGVVRNGQCLTFDGDVVWIGDVNPGGTIVASGDIYIFGRLRGVAHAGASGLTTAVIAAAEFAPLQLRIADIVSRAPETQHGRSAVAFMEFAYVKDGVMAVDKLAYRASLVGE
ncbi:septum site-determining protein MinC [Alicyclobacillus sp. ALC3]|uniref:septum site-determining protein MinC n=1 Tax=Alicyclobacillus sp. ALC3 TaxID=2796143 RepID=UPI002379E512|nr:septum site-determining protein MinC [Alicyclobacillus sp. ALC3]